MTEHPTNVGQFTEAHALAERLYTLQKDQADRMLNLLTEHGKTLNTLAIDMVAVKGQTRELPELTKRVGKLEVWKAFVAGIAAAFTMIGGSIGWVIGTLVKR